MELGSGEFTIECWMYLTGALGNYDFISKDSSLQRAWAFYMSSTQIKTLLFYSDSSFDNFDTNFTFVPYQWNHVAISRSGNTVRQFVNGALIGTLNIGSAKSLADTTAVVKIGARVFGDGTDNYFPGYISDARIVKGTALYTAAFTPPTAPLTAVSNTQLLTNFTNAGIFDNTGKNNLETVGNAQIDTTTKKYGTGSMEFDGTTDYLFIPNDVNNTLGTGDYTIEFWVYANSWTSTPVLVEYGRATNGSTPGLEFYISNTSGKLDIYGGSTTGTLLVSAGTNISTGSWTHVALTRASGSTKLFLNGTQTGSTATDTTNYTQATIFIGAYFAGGLCLNGFIDDFRVTKGVARYTAAFTAPTKAFPDQ